MSLNKQRKLMQSDIYNVYTEGTVDGIQLYDANWLSVLYNSVI
jgi:hypothetical protein